MERFLTRHASRISGILSGFDRLLFRGQVLSISFVDGMDRFLSSQRILYKDFGAFAQHISDRVKRHAETIALQAGRPFEYLASPQVRKDERAVAIAEAQGIQEGLVCVFSCVEPCQSFTIRRDPAGKRLRLVAGERKCLYVYFYFLDPEFGLMHVRLQTWLPLTIQVCVNGREWLARQLTRAGISYTQQGNCFTELGDVRRAQALADDLMDWPWETMLKRLGAYANPWVTGAPPLLRDYYWTIRQAEYATDVMFRNRPTLQSLYPALVRHAIEQFQSEDILRFLGRTLTARCQGEIHSDLQRRFDGLRIKHWIEENSLKMYDKAASVLRIETTINNPRRFHVLRPTRDKRLAWQRLRKGIADIRRRVDICRAANARYLDALSVVGEPTPSHHLLDSVSRRVIRDGRPYRPLHPISPKEAPVFRCVLDGKFAVQGFRNIDLRAALRPDADRDPVQCRRASGQVTRVLRLLRAHGLIKKVPRTRYYRVTMKGHQVISTALRFRGTNLALLAA
jgi:hypothetical protein